MPFEGAPFFYFRIKYLLNPYISECASILKIPFTTIWFIGYRIPRINK